jgi:hypothetical protein
MSIKHAALHSTIARSFVDRGCAPTIAQLSAAFNADPTSVADALRALEASHGVVLHPHSGEVWALHPFSAAPTGFWVESARGGWWGNCAWCALGVAALVGGDVTITTRAGAERETVTIRIVEGEIAPADAVIHFPVPMVRAWDNVTYTCSVMLVFTDAAAVDDWCVRHAIPRGDVRPLSQIWPFAQAWYGRHLDTDWRKWTSAEAAALFASFGLDGPIWQLPETPTRF